MILSNVGFFKLKKKSDPKTSLDKYYAYHKDLPGLCESDYQARIGGSS